MRYGPGGCEPGYCKGYKADWNSDGVLTGLACRDTKTTGIPKICCFDDQSDASCVAEYNKWVKGA